ncbi:MAG TPA: hypothetical protein VFQ61_34385, partial [Polyangiaceae bacterium]|nr:hypothetical protein [Polyangiaceae bacterium]
HYENSGVPLMVLGSELGVRRDLRQGYLLAVSYGVLAARYLSDDSFGAVFSFRKNPEFRSVANVPVHRAVVKGIAPIFGRSLSLASRITLESGRYDRLERRTEVAQGRSSGVALWDLVLTGKVSDVGIDWAVGLYNAFDYRYSLPTSDEFPMRTVPQSGRSFLLSLDVTL